MQAYIIRLVWANQVPTVTSPAPAAAATAKVTNVGGALTLFASSPGTWGDTVSVRLVPKTGDATRFTLQVIDATNGNVLESFANLSVSASYPQDYMVMVVDTDSQYVTFVDPTNPGAAIASPASVSADTIPKPVGVNVANQPGGSLPASTQFFYTVSAIFPDGESQPSDEHNATTSATNNKTMHVAWTAPSFNGNSPTGYRISRGAAAGAENVYFIVPGTAISFDDDGSVAASPGLPQPTAGVAQKLDGGKDGAVLTPSTADFDNVLLNDPSGHGGLPLLDRVPIFNLLCVPGETNAPTVQQLQKYCADNRAFCIVDPKQSATASSRCGRAGRLG